jgi:hypothetical protein
LREAFDRAVDDARRLGIAGRQELIEALLVDLAAGLVAERILAELAKRLAPSFDELAKGSLLARSPTKPSSSFSSTL